MKTLCVTLLIFSALLQGRGLMADEALAPGASNALPLAREGTGAREAALGSAFVGLAEGTGALFYNPAGLANINNPELAFHHKSYFAASSTQETVALGFPLGAFSGMGLSVDYTDNGSFESRDESGAQLGDYQARNYGGRLGWAVGGKHGLALGIAGKFNRQDLAGQTYDTFSGDAGALWEIHPLLNLGVSYVNWGADVAGSALATALRAGLSSFLVDTREDRLIFLAALETRSADDHSLQFGVENSFMRFVALRAGYNMDMASNAPAPGLNNWSFGGGVKIGALSVDYAFLPHDELGDSHRVSVGYRFGNPENAASLDEYQPPIISEQYPGNESVVILMDQDFDDKGDGSEKLSKGAKSSLDLYLSPGGTPAKGLRVETRSALPLDADELKGLGSRRAVLVRDYMVSKGVSAGRITLQPGTNLTMPDSVKREVTVYQVVLR